MCLNMNLTMKKDKRQLSHSQNFLKSSGFVNSLIERTSINSGDLVVEIGPGKGIITAELAKKAGMVIAVEYDSNLARNLKVRFSGHSNIEIIESDFLEWPLPNKPYKVFANIPFNITADMVGKLLSGENSPEAIYLIMQDKAAGRFMGPPFGPNSQASILLQPFYDMGVVINIDKRKFAPIPNVSAVLAKFARRLNPLIDPKLRELYRDFVIYGYNQWQPTILDAFKKIFTDKQLNVLAKNLVLDGLAPSELSVDKWMGMFNSFIQYTPQERKDIVKGAEKRLRFRERGMQKQYRTRISQI